MTTLLALDTAIHHAASASTRPVGVLATEVSWPDFDVRTPQSTNLRSKEFQSFALRESVSFLESLTLCFAVRGLAPSASLVSGRELRLHLSLPTLVLDPKRTRARKLNEDTSGGWVAVSCSSARGERCRRPRRRGGGEINHLCAIHCLSQCLLQCL